MSSRTRRLLRLAAGALVVLLAAYALRALTGLGGDGVGDVFDTYLYNLLICSAAAGCLLRAWLVRAERTAWLVLGLGMVAWALGEIYFSAFLADQAEPPFPSVADALYLAFYPASYAAIWLLVRERIARFDGGLFVDGLIGALALGALAAALAFQAILDASVGNAAAVATNLAYPLADMLLLGVAVGVIALTGWRPGRTWLFIAAGLAVSAVADGVFLYQIANETYVEGTLLDALWPASMLLIAYAAWQPALDLRSIRLAGWRVFALPSAFGAIGIGLLGLDHFERLNELAFGLAMATLAAVVGRMMLLFKQNLVMLERTQREALTDALTGLGNRRRLMLDLQTTLEQATLADSRVLIAYDLDGFKQYNDTFGHPAGDELLARLGARLGAAVAPYGRAYRMGGDEFCALVQVGRVGIDALVAASDAALTEHGEGFEVTASQGHVVLPQEAEDVAFALQLADGRMYLDKGQRRTSPRRQTRDVLLQALRERTPDLDEHLHGVAELARRVGVALELSVEQLDELTRAAELHDVGKMAIPDGILSKPGALDAEEWRFMRRHTIFGERILAAAPALLPVARLVRSSHEHFDGSGYPDALCGEQIPLGSRIILVCDSYHAMVTDRPYRRAVGHDEAVAELQRRAGVDFDPAIVAVFQRVVGQAPTALGAREAPARSR